ILGMGGPFSFGHYITSCRHGLVTASLHHRDMLLPCRLKYEMERAMIEPRAASLTGMNFRIALSKRLTLNLDPLDSVIRAPNPDLITAPGVARGAADEICGAFVLLFYANVRENLLDASTHVCFASAEHILVDFVVIIEQGESQKILVAMQLVACHPIGELFPSKAIAQVNVQSSEYPLDRPGEIEIGAEREIRWFCRFNRCRGGIGKHYRSRGRGGSRRCDRSCGRTVDHVSSSYNCR